MAVVALVLGSAAWGADSPPPKPQLSASAGPDLIKAQKANTDKKYDEAIAILDKVKANPKKSEYDEYVMNEFYFQAYAGLKRYQDAEAPLEATLASKYLSPENRKIRLYQGAVLNYQLKNYAKALDFGKQAIDAGDTRGEVKNLVVQADYLNGNYKETDQAARSLVDEEVKAGETPTQELLEIGLSAGSKLNDEPMQVHWLELLVTYHPTAEYWEDLRDTVYHYKLTDRQTLQLYRLSADLGLLKKGSEYEEMAQLASDGGFPGETVAVLNKAFAANAFTDPTQLSHSQKLLESAKKKAAADEAGLPALEAESAKAPTGDGLIGAGVGYFSYGNYAKAVADISAGLAKGTSKDTSDARLILGISQLRTGDKDGAIKSFQSVMGDAVYQRLAALWILRAKSPATSGQS